MAFTTENPFGTGTDQEILDFWRGYVATLPVLGRTRTIKGRIWEGPEETGALQMVKYWESRVSIADGPAINYARRQRPL